MKWFPSDLRKCAMCDLSVKRTQVVLGYGSRNPRFIIVGEAPGKDEDRIGKPFVGRCGKLLDKLLAEIGIDRSEIFITNSVLCRPPLNKTPIPIQLMSCRDRLMTTLSMWLCPIVVLGGVAMGTVTGERGIMRFRFEVYNWFDSKGRDRIVLPALHPSAVLRRGIQEGRDDFQFIKEHVL